MAHKHMHRSNECGAWPARGRASPGARLTHLRADGDAHAHSGHSYAQVLLCLIRVLAAAALSRRCRRPACRRPRLRHHPLGLIVADVVVPDHPAACSKMHVSLGGIMGPERPCVWESGSLGGVMDPERPCGTVSRKWVTVTQKQRMQRCTHARCTNLSMKNRPFHVARTHRNTRITDSQPNIDG